MIRYVVWIVSDFCGRWLATREFRRLALGAPAVIIMLIASVGVLSRPFLSTEHKSGRYYDAAQNAIEAQDLETTAMYLEKIWLLDPSNYPVFFRLVLQLAESVDAQQAYEFMRRLAPDDEPRYAPAHKWMVRALINGQLSATEQAPLNLAKTHLEYIDRVSKRDAEANYLWYFYHARAGNVESAFERLKEAVKEAPMLAFTLMRLQIERNEIDEAKQAATIADRFLRRQIAGDASPERYAQLAQVLETLDDQTAAQRVLHEAIEQFPDDQTLDDQLLAVQLRQYDRLTSVENPSAFLLFDLLHQMLKAAPNNAEVLTRIAQLFGKRRSSADAKQLVNRLLREHDESGELANMLGARAASEGDFATARNLLLRAIKQNANLSVAHNNYAWVLSNSEPKDLEQSLENANKALELSPDDHRFRETRGQVFVQLGRWHKAIADLEYALNGMPESEPVHTSLALAYENIGKMNLARAHRDHVATPDPQSP